MNNLLFITLIFGCFIASFLSTKYFMHYASRKGLIDHPNHRSSHLTAKPSGGGIVIAIMTCSLWLTTIFFEILSLKQGLSLLLAGGVVAIVGFLDDQRHISRKIRFTLHVLVSSISVALLYPLPHLPITESYALNFNTVFMPLIIIALVWLTNLYNFMDGIDGIAASVAVAILTTTAFTLYFFDADDLALLLSLFAFIISGFLILNFPPAKLFMGDIGSTFIGITLGILAIICSNTLSLWYWIIILACFVGDASWTLIIRIISGQAWRDGHRLHAYQKMASQPNKHQVTTLLYTCVTLFWLFPIAYWAENSHSNQLAKALLAYAPILIFCFYHSAGMVTTKTADRKNKQI